jgi:putative flippase GtrA
LKAQALLLQLIDWFYPVFKRFMPLKTYRYAVCGGSNLLLDILLYFLVYHFAVQKEDLDLGFLVLSPHIAALFIVFPITFFTGFLLNKFIAFAESTLQSKTQLRRYLMVTAGAIFLNYLLMKLFVDVLDFYPTPSKILTTALSVVYSYTLQSKYSFK